MPIESRRISRECPSCKNGEVFRTNKGYFCAKCLGEFPLDAGDKPEIETVELDNDKLRTGDHTPETDQKNEEQVQIIADALKGEEVDKIES